MQIRSTVRVRHEEPIEVSHVTKYNEGSEPKYGKKGSTARGTAWCKKCGTCVGHMLLFENNMVVGWFETECCDEKINWINADEEL